jgi:L-erythro-3,5-diaminohexanoate dehydrogenase
LILGAGKSGALAAAAIAETVPPQDLWFSDVSDVALERAMGLGVAQNAFRTDAQDPLSFAERQRDSGAPLFDLVVNTCNAPETETAAILAARPGGRVLFFNMATSFSRAVLSAEGLGRDLQLVMGNGYAEGHAPYALDLLRRHAGLRRFFGEAKGES